MENTTNWIEHLQNPLVLIGFVLFLFAGLFKLIKTEKITGKASAALFNKGMNYLFILAIVIVIAGFALSFYQTHTEQQTTQTPPQTTEISTKGKQSPAVQSGEDVNINYGGTLSEQSKQTPKQEKTAPQPPTDVKTEGEQSPAVSSGGDVNINYSQ